MQLLFELFMERLDGVVSKYRSLPGLSRRDSFPLRHGVWVAAMRCATLSVALSFLTMFRSRASFYPPLETPCSLSRLFHFTLVQV